MSPDIPSAIPLHNNRPGNCWIVAKTISNPNIELRGFAPSGMVECWNHGIMGSGKKESWVIVKFLFTGIKWRDVIFFKSSFHHSIIPCPS
jgi:hypothetical protein